MVTKNPKAPKRKKPRPLDPTKKKTKTKTKEEKSYKKNKKSSKNPNLIPVGKNSLLDAKKRDDENKVGVSTKKKDKKRKGDANAETFLLSVLPPDEQLRFFLDRFQSANGIKLSPLELEAFRDSCIVKLSEEMDQGVDNFSEHMKTTFGNSWREVLCDGKLCEGKIDAGSPAILIITISALRSLELLRGLKSFTRECRPAKLFAKHLKLEDQVTQLKNRVNIASGTPSRIKKLIDMDALLLSRLELVVFDMQKDAKGYTLFTLPQVSTEFWDLYNSHFQQRLLQGDTRFCFYGPTPHVQYKKALRTDDE